MKFGTLSRDKPSLLRHRGKGGAQAMLPNRAAVTKLVNAPLGGSMADFSQATPLGFKAPSYPALPTRATRGVDVK